jgi:hypothetical protein
MDEWWVSLLDFRGCIRNLGVDKLTKKKIFILDKGDSFTTSGQPFSQKKHIHL